jgi:hypothetical protein
MDCSEIKNSKDEKYIIGMPKIVGKIKLPESKSQINQDGFDSSLWEGKVKVKKKRGRIKVSIEGSAY